MEALVAHTSPELVDIVLANNQFGARTPPNWSAEPVKLRWPPAGASPPRLVLDDVIDPDNAHHHQPARLAGALIRVLEANRGIRHRAVSRSA